ncbi:ScyD/ScyE family protein [Fibrisoma montanum]|uniref:ScyD/ScyE family protein n=1 Tax=Fibrisoma montanum TaxID=2305895 RepID=A0A418M8L4_9BACT|nr:ScyD/ScyE family protein [Fibrisoma montanum]RIV22432.1 ScyD/ScyE family protein [Fibrisoma montanum]
MRTNLLNIGTLLTCLFVFGCQDHRELGDPSQLQVQEVASNLAAPLGVATDPQGRLWVTEVAAGKVTLIMPDGQKYPVVTGFNVAVSPENTPDGLNHLVYKDGMLYILHGVDEKMYKLNVSSFKPGDQPLMASQLDSEPIGQFVLDYNFGAADTQDSNLYNLIFGPDGDLYIADAGANAIIKRSKTGQLSVFATVPGIPNPTMPMVGPPFVQSVPTGIVFDGQKFLVTTLLGFPFPADKARIYQIDLAGNVSLYQDGFTSLVDIALGANQRPIVLQVAQFGAMGPMPNTGRLLQSKNGQINGLLQGLNLPTSVEAATAANTYYISSLANGTIQRVTY